MGRETDSFLVGKLHQLGEGVFGPSQETMAVAEQKLLDLVSPDVKKAGVKPGCVHQIFSQKNGLLFGDIITADAIEIEVGADGKMGVGKIERREISELTKIYRDLGVLVGRARLAVINKKIRELTEPQA